MTNNWSRWNPETARGALAHYVKPATVGSLLHLPGASNQAPMARLREVYTALAAKRIRYSFEHDASQPGRQVIRPPEQILGTPGHGTCLDLAVTMAGACKLAGLASMVIVVESDHAPAARHALVGVFVAASATPYPLTGDVHDE